MKKIIVLGLLIVLASCSLLSDTFDDVSAPYLSRYGPPEDEHIYDSTGYCCIKWWWWSQGFMVSFTNVNCNHEYGWYVESEYSFSPI